MQWRNTIVSVVLAGCILFPGANAQMRLVQNDRATPSDLPALQFSGSGNSKSVMLAIGASLLLPGLGEYYAGNFESSGKYALTAEGIIWVTYSAFRLHGTWLKDDARAFAVDRAGVSFSGKDAQFDVDLGNFLTTQEYNETKLRNRQTDLLYTDPSYSWVWDNDADRQAFRSQRIRADGILETSKFIVAAAVVNRLVSAFSAGRAAAAHNRTMRARFSINLDYVPEMGLPRTEGTMVRLAYRF